jgi:tetratricopeptide (TPR) repeat protein
MAFQGDLRNIGLATVFQNLNQNVQSGTLRVERDELQRFVFIRDGRIAMFTVGAGVETPIGEFLIRAGKITPDDLDSAVKKRRKGSRLGGVLERAGQIDEKATEAAVRQYIEEELYDLFTWTDGKFEFQEGAPSEELFDLEMRNTKIALDPNGIILEAARRVDEWERINRIVGSLGDIYVVKRERQDELGAVPDARVKRVAEFLDGRRDVAAVIRDSALGRFAVCNALSRLVGERLVRPISVDELRQLSQQAEMANDIDEAMRLMRRALDLEHNDITLRKQLAALLERAGEKQQAATEYKLLANSYVDSGKTNSAVDVLRKAIELMPSDVTARERLFRLLSDSGGKTVAIETGIDLAGTYSTLGLSEKARDALVKLLALNPANRAGIERKLVEAHLAMGDVKAAIEQLRKMAHRAMKGREYEEAGGLYEELLKLDSKDEEARKRVAEIQAGVVERLMEQRRARTRVLIVAAVLVPLGVFVARELLARPAETTVRLSAIRTGIDAARQLEMAKTASRADAGPAFERAGEGFDGAIQGINEFRRTWGWTLASRLAGKELVEWQSLSADAWLQAAKAYESVALFDEAYRIFQRVERAQGVPASAADMAHEAAKRLEKQGLVTAKDGGGP